MDRHATIKIKESDLKRTLKEYLDMKHIFHFPIVQGIGSYRGAPDRVIHLDGEVIYLEIKLPNGKMSEYQLAFQKQCELDDVGYEVIRSLEDLQALIDPQAASSTSGKPKKQGVKTSPNSKPHKVKSRG